MKCRQIVFTKPFTAEYIDTEISELSGFERSEVK